MNRTQILEITEAFPPAHGLTETLLNIDYKKHFNLYMDGVMIVCAVLVTLYQFLAAKWQENDCTERLQLAALTAYTWIREVAVPGVKNATVAVYQAGRNVRGFYEVISSPLFITL
jgi:hypothetical protein